MAQQVANDNAFISPSIIQFEIGPMLAHRVVPLHRAVIDQLTNQGRSDSFGARSERKNSFDVNRLDLRQGAAAVAFEIDNLPLMHDGNGTTRDFPFRQCGSNEGVNFIRWNWPRRRWR
jgi:hypothetical protein